MFAFYYMGIDSIHPSLTYNVVQVCVNNKNDLVSLRFSYNKRQSLPIIILNDKDPSYVCTGTCS